MTDILTDTFAMGEEDGYIRLEFPKPVTAVKMNPSQAKALGIALAKEAYKAETGSNASGATVITKQLEAKLVIRLTKVIKNLQDKGRAPGFIANEVMGIVLREVS